MSDMLSAWEVLTNLLFYIQEHGKNTMPSLQYFRSHVDALLVSAFFLTSVLLRGANILNTSPYPDESLYLIDSLNLICNDWVWPKESMLFQPPLFIYVQAIFIRLFGSGLEFTRYISVITGSLTVCLIYLLGKTMYDRRVGFLSAVFLGFLSYHIVYCRITQIEAIALFFITGTLYFFWKGYTEQKIIYYFAAGIFQGLAIDTKYAGFTVLVAIIMFVLWNEKSWKALIDRKLIVFFVVSFLVFLPVLIMLYLNDVNIFYYNFIERQTMHYNSPSYFSSAAKLPVTDLIVRGFRNYVEMLTHDEYFVPWSPVFLMSAIVLFPCTVFYCIYSFLKKRQAESLLLIYFIISLALILFLYRFKYYLLYSLVPYVIMTSYLTVSSIDHIKRNKSIIPLFTRSLYIAMAAILICTNVFVGVMTPIHDKGEFDGFSIALQYVDRQLNEYSTSPNTKIIGFVHLAESSTSSTFISLHDVKNINWDYGFSPLIMMKMKKNGAQEVVMLDLDAIRKYEPVFLVTSKIDYDYYVGINERKELLKQYDLAFSSKMINPYEKEYIVFKRKS